MRAAIFSAALCLVSTMAVAADYPMTNDPDYRTPLRGPILPPAPTPALQAPVGGRSPWTGFYVGVNAGYGGGYDAYTLSPLSGATNPSGTLTVHSSGAIGGAQAGYSQYLGGAVVGIEADFDGSTISGGAHAYFDQTSALSGGSRVNYFGTVRGRLGYAFGPALIYGTGGFAYAGTTSSVTADNYGSLSSTRTHMGYAFGGGVEYAVAENITLRTEFIRAVFDTRQLAAASDGYGDGAQLTHTPSINVVRAGVNFRIPTLLPTPTPPPIVARY